MASTYTPSLRFNLMGTGDQIGTWGSTLNQGVFTLADFSIAGITEVALSNSNVTLTTANGATDEARAAILMLSGTLSNNVTIQIPNASKSYIVYNGTSGAFTVGIKTASGGALTVTQGTSSLVWCDGSNNVRLVGDVSGDIAAAVTAHNVDTSAHYAASETQRGFIELATSAEAITGTDTTRGIVPATLKAAVLDIFFPVGTIYETSNAAFDPNTAWGGTWSVYGAGRTLFCYDAGQAEFNTVGGTGGNKNKTLSVGELPAHDHPSNVRMDSNAPLVDGAKETAVASGGSLDVSGASSTISTDTGDTGSSTPFSLLNPYITIMRWRRSA